MKLDLERIVAHLRHLEETIIYLLLERAQNPANLGSYEDGKSGFEGLEDKSMFHIALLLDEQKDATLGRFCTPEERPFNSGLPEPKRKVVLPGIVNSLRIDDFDKINLTPEILKTYIALIPKLCGEDDDFQHGSSTRNDVDAIKRISERIHYGSFYVPEAKFQDDIIGYHRLIEAGDVNGLEERLTRKQVEDQILERVRAKVIDIQRNVDKKFRYKVNPEAIVEFYREAIIYLTKKGEIRYLFERSKTLFEAGQRYELQCSRVISPPGWGSSDRVESYRVTGTFKEHRGQTLFFQNVKNLVYGGADNEIKVPFFSISKARLVA